MGVGALLNGGAAMISGSPRRGDYWTKVGVAAGLGALGGAVFGGFAAIGALGLAGSALSVRRHLKD